MKPEFDRYLAAYESWKKCSAAHTEAVQKFAAGDAAARDDLPRLLTRCNESYRKFLDEANAIASWKLEDQAPPEPRPQDDIVRH